MVYTHQTQIIKIGNSNGVRIPKEFLKEFSNKNVMIELVKNSLIITPVQSQIVPRLKWDAIMAKTKIEIDDEFNDFDITQNNGLDNI